jgi:two-component system chemotaxis response regulator CheB
MNISPSDTLLPETEAVVIGGSAGAVSALSHLLPPLPPGYPLPILIVVHLPAEKQNSIAQLFQTTCRMTVKEAEDKEPILRGTIYFAPPDYHLLVEQDRFLSLSRDEPVNFSRPSIDVLFESAADAYRRALLAVVLTGANHDGARGVLAVCQAGGVAIVQSPESAEARIMPNAALAACERARPMSLLDIAQLLHQRAV